MNRALFVASLLASVALAAGCSSSGGGAATPASPAPTPDAGAQDAAPSDPPCDAPKLTFKRSPIAIDPTRDHHHTFVREVNGTPYLYVLGGEQEDFAVVLDDVQRAKINADGSLEAFEKIGTIPRGRAGAGFAVVGDDVILAGGAVGQPAVDFTNETLIARFDADGKLPNWKTGPTLPSKVMHAAAVVVDRDVYITGGTKGSAPANFSVRGTVAADGTIASYVKQPDLDPARSHHAAFVKNGALYIVGGLDKGPVGNPPSRSDVVRAKIKPGGDLDAWEGVGDLGSPLSVSAAQPLGCSVLFLGGLDDRSKGGPFSADVLRGSILANGQFRPESTLDSKLSTKRGHVHQTPIFKDRFLYSVGGRDNNLSTIGAIDIGTIEP
jgi:hypothetical protein